MFGSAFASASPAPCGNNSTKYAGFGTRKIGPTSEPVMAPPMRHIACKSNTCTESPKHKCQFGGFPHGFSAVHQEGNKLLSPEHDLQATYFNKDQLAAHESYKQKILDLRLNPSDERRILEFVERQWILSTTIETPSMKTEIESIGRAVSQAVKAAVPGAKTGGRRSQSPSNGNTNFRKY